MTTYEKSEYTKSEDVCPFCNSFAFTANYAAKVFLCPNHNDVVTYFYNVPNSYNFLIHHNNIPYQIYSSNFTEIYILNNLNLKEAVIATLPFPMQNPEHAKSTLLRILSLSPYL